jgi:uncharacterized membrane protein YiaA
MGNNTNETKTHGSSRIKIAAQSAYSFYNQTRSLFLLTVFTRSILRLLQLLTYFLPLKIIILVSYEEPPNWLAEYVSPLGDSPAFTLVGIFAILYLAYLATSAAHHKLFNADALAQLSYSDLNWSKKQARASTRAHKKAVEICSDITIIVMGLLSIAVASLALASFILILVCLFLFVALMLTTPSQRKSADKRTVDQIIANLASVFLVLLFAGLLSGILIFSANVFVTVYALVVGRALILACDRVARSISPANFFSGL